MSKTEESMQEAGSNSEEFGQGDQECFSHCPQSSSWRGRMKQTEKVSNSPQFGSLPHSFCLPLISDLS